MKFIITYRKKSCPLRTAFDQKKTREQFIKAMP